MFIYSLVHVFSSMFISTVKLQFSSAANVQFDAIFYKSGHVHKSRYIASRSRFCLYHEPIISKFYNSVVFFFKFCIFQSLDILFELIRVFLIAKKESYLSACNL